ncbi:hypothetical protein CRUP_005353 [Coryphaenoides rupestris]|nr:hypothetical protein CRUP_005353 [Coryphaenoides rupestris]
MVVLVRSRCCWCAPGVVRSWSADALPVWCAPGAAGALPVWCAPGLLVRSRCGALLVCWCAPGVVRSWCGALPVLLVRSWCGEILVWCAPGVVRSRYCWCAPGVVRSWSAGALPVLLVRSRCCCVVTELCLDYGMIDDAVYFTGAQVLGGVLLRVGDAVDGVAVRDGAHGGWRALRVEKSLENWEGGDSEADSMKLRPLIGMVTSLNADGGFINQNTFFPGHSLGEGYVPMVGDWVQAQYYLNLSKCASQAQSVVPLRYRRLDEVCVSSVYGRNGVVDETVYFSLDSLLLPSDYKPSTGDTVNLVMVESTQSFYSWRALCMAPRKELGNKGSETHRLKCCTFAGWDSERQFSLVPGLRTANGKAPRWAPARPSPRPAPEPHVVQQAKEGGGGGGEGKEVSTGNRDAGQEANGKGARATDATTGKTGGQECGSEKTEEVEVDIAPGGRLSVAVGCTAKNIGGCSELLLLHFSSFTIGRRLEVKVGSKEARLLQPTSAVTKCEAPLCASAPPARVVTVSAQHVPWRECVESQRDVLVVQPCLGEVLAASNMRARFDVLLWLEELRCERELKDFSIGAAILRRRAQYLLLDIPGLAEGRPSLFFGDRIILKEPQRAAGVVTEYIGYVVEIHEEEVSLRVNADLLQHYQGEPLDVEFTYGRLTMRRCHQALEQAKHFGGILFPTELSIQPPQWAGKWLEEEEPAKEITKEDGEVMTTGNPEKGSSVSVDMQSKATQTKAKPTEGRFFNPQLNPSQREAVRRILAGECRPIPYVLFGPPGTGKTITLIETILQVYHFIPSSRVLVCTPSNSAADLICSRLHHSGFLHAASLARINASSRQEECLPLARPRRLDVTIGC